MWPSLLLLPLAAFSASSHAVINARDAAAAPSTDFPQYAPVPASALGAKIGPEGYVVESFGLGCYMVSEGAYQALFLVSDKGVIVVDNPPTIGHKLLYAIGNVTSQPITHVIYSHSHGDHIGGASLLPPKAEIIAHEDTAELLAESPDPTRPAPKKTFKDEYRLTVGNQTLLLSYKGENHVRGNIFIYAPKQKTLMLVDVVFPGWTPFAKLGLVKNVPGFIRAHDQILSYDFTHFVGGHLERSGDRKDVETQREYVHDLYDNCAATIRLSATEDPTVGGGKILGGSLAKNPGNTWAAFRTYLDVTSEYCAKKTNEKWGKRLAAADVFQVSNAETMIESQRTDWAILGPFAAT